MLAHAACLLVTTAVEAAPPPANPEWPWGIRAATLFRPLLKDSEFELDDRMGLLRRLGYDTVIIGVQHFPLDHIADWPELQEWSRRIADAAHRHGMGAIEHHSAGVFHTDHVADQHNGHRLEEMSPLNIATSQPDIYLGSMIFACPNNPLHWEVYSDYARGMLTHASLDGYMPDDVEILHDTTSCACEHCRAEFLRRYGADLPGAEDTIFWGNYANPLYRQWLRFRQQSVGGFHHRMRELRDALSPDTKLLTCQCQPAGVGLNVTWALAHDEIAPDMDILFLEACNAFGYFSDWGFWATDAKLLQAMGRGRKPVLPLFYPGSVTKPYAALFSSQEAQAQSRLRGYWDNEVSQETGAYERVVYDDPTQQPGATECFFLWAFARLFADGLWMESSFDLAAEGLRFEAEHADLFRRTDSVATIALHYSRQTRDFYGPADSFHVDEWRGWAMLLLRDNLPFDVVLDEDLAAPLPARVRLLILPNAACLSNAQLQEVRRFVRRGGRLLASGDTSGFTEEGDRRPDLALGGVLGVRHVDTLRGANARAVWEGTPGPRRLKVAGDVTLVKTTGRARAVGQLVGLDRAAPAGVIGPSGRTLYLAARAGLLGAPQRPVGAEGGRARWLGPWEPGWGEVALASVHSLLPAGSAVRLINAPEGLVMAASRNHDRVVVQLLNATGGLRRPGEAFDPSECVFPPLPPDAKRPLRLWLRAPRPSRVTLVSPDADRELLLSARAAGGGWQVALPSAPLRRYAVVTWAP